MGLLGVSFEWSDWQGEMVWWLQSVFVDSSYRRQAIFTKLLQHLQTMAKSQNITRIRLYRESHNISAASVYQKLGFQNLDYKMMELNL